MDLFEIIKEYPGVILFAGVVIFAALFGKKKEWEFEAKLVSEKDKRINGEIEIKKYQKAPPLW